MLSAEKYEVALKGVTPTARKVFDSVPISEGWHATQIASEIFRKGLRLDVSMISGCLDSLTKTGVIAEKPRGVFIRVPVKSKAKPIASDHSPQTPQTPEAQPMTQAKPQTPIEKLGALSQRVTVAMNALKDIASDIEAAAIEIDEHIAQSSVESQKLQQLKTLLKSLG